MQQSNFFGISNWSNTDVRPDKNLNFAWPTNPQEVVFCGGENISKSGGDKLQNIMQNSVNISNNIPLKSRRNQSHGQRKSIPVHLNFSSEEIRIIFHSKSESYWY